MKCSDCQVCLQVTMMHGMHICSFALVDALILANLTTNTALLAAMCWHASMYAIYGNACFSKVAEVDSCVSTMSLTSGDMKGPVS